MSPAPAASVCVCSVSPLFTVSEPELQAPLGRQESGLDLPPKSGQVLGTRGPLGGSLLILRRGLGDLYGVECRLSGCHMELPQGCEKVFVGAAANF